MAKQRTLGEIEDLKAQWDADPCWDIEETDGFAYHYQELTLYREKRQAEWRQESTQRTKDKAAELGCPDNLKLAEYVMSLEERIEALDKRLEKLENA